MEELITIREKKGIQLVDSRELHRRLKVGKRYTTWLQGRIREYSFELNQDYFIEYQTLSQNGERVPHRPRTNYFITVDMAKELAMIERNEIGRKFRRYFIEVEKRSRMLMPQAIVSETGERMVSYYHWLLANGYSVNSGQVRARIRKYPHLFWRSSRSGVVYVSERYTKMLLAWRNGAYNPCKLPSVSPEQKGLFDDAYKEGL